MWATRKRPRKNYDTVVSIQRNSIRSGETQKTIGTEKALRRIKNWERCSYVEGDKGRK